MKKSTLNDVLLKATEGLVREMLKFDLPLDALLTKGFRDNRKLGIRDRDLMANTCYTILRNYNKLTKIVPPKRTFMLIVYTWRRLLGFSDLELNGLKSVDLLQIEQLPTPDFKTIELPAWIIELLSSRYTPAEINQLDKAMVEAPVGLTLRVNTLKQSRSTVLTKLHELGINATATNFSPFGISIPNKLALMKNQLFLDGVIEVQDESSQLAAMLLNPKRGEMVVDFCAGAGGKTLVFGNLMHNTGRIYAFDINSRRLTNLTPRLARSGLSNVYPQLINDENDNKVKRLYDKIDKVFVDAPCLGLGTLKRNPDLKFRYNQEQLSKINQEQLAILTSASKLVKSGGKLVYATCSILYAENQAIIEQFLLNNREFFIVKPSSVLHDIELELADENFLELLPHVHGTDGFFACLLGRN